MLSFFCKYIKYFKINRKAFLAPMVILWMFLVVICDCLWPAVCLTCSFSFPIPHPQPSVLIVSYIESAKAATQFGFYQKAEWKPDDSMIAVAVSTAMLLLISRLTHFAPYTYTVRTLISGQQKVYTSSVADWKPICFNCILANGKNIMSLFCINIWLVWS